MGNKERRWEIIEAVKKKAEKLTTAEIIDVLLAGRGITTPSQKEAFFHPPNPNELNLKELGLSEKEVEKAIKRIKKAIAGKETIIIYGDYDADGICGTGILFETLYQKTDKVLPHLPNRFNEGYGLNSQSVRNLKTKFRDLGLIITVDNGITALEAVDAASELGIDVIITDHHLRGEVSPKACACVHTETIGGAGIAWILAKELRKSLKIKEGNLKHGDGLDLAALGTIADVLPLVGPNRSLAWHGTNALQNTKRPGLLALYQEAGIKNPIGSYEVGYIIAPRINAAGRLEDPIKALQLLCTASFKRASSLAGELGLTNRKRQETQEQIVVSVKEMAAQVSDKKVFVFAKESYHEGVIGLAAAKLVEEYYRPAIVIAKKGKDSKASARSIPGFNLIQTLKQLEDEFNLKLGGHEMAAGFSIATDRIDLFSTRFEEVAGPLITDAMLERSLKIDLIVEFSNLTLDLARQLRTFRPFGTGNPTPTFATNDVSVISANSVGRDGNHLKLKLEKDGIEIQAIGFGLGQLTSNLKSKRKINIAYDLRISEWSGQEELELTIRDVKMAL